ncbi:MAG: hypothetical protein DMG72_04255 [Acidobacteria bacterium]|nr:MAG: hypothetical protein DMG72_04255 [Acidobacteriota bacterium]
MTKRLYYHDSFLYDFDAEVVDVIAPSKENPRPALVLDRTAFYPASGGQVFDTGWIVPVSGGNGPRLRVAETAEREDGVSCIISRLKERLRRAAVFTASSILRGAVTMCSSILGSTCSPLRSCACSACPHFHSTWERNIAQSIWTPYRSRRSRRSRRSGCPTKSSWRIVPWIFDLSHRRKRAI